MISFLTKVKLLIIFTLVLALLSPMSSASENGIYVGAYSDHFVSDYQYNEEHNKIAVSYENLVVGYFKNSYSDDTYFAGYEKELYKSKYAEAGIKFGAMYGYRSCVGKHNFNGDKKVCPMGVPYIRLKTKYVKPEFLLLGSAAVITFRFDIHITN